VKPSKMAASASVSPKLSRPGNGGFSRLPSGSRRSSTENTEGSRPTLANRFFCVLSSLASGPQTSGIMRRPRYQPAVNSPKHSLEANQSGVTRHSTTRHEPLARRRVSVHLSPARIESWSTKISSNPCRFSHASTVDARASSRLECEKK